MNLPPERQGHLSDLSKKTLGELKELLERQEKILARSAFIRTLPDKGEKCAAFAEYLRSVICQKSETSADRNTLMKDLTNSSFSKQSGIPINLMTDVKEKEHKMDLSESLQKLSIGFNENLQKTESVQNAYERVVKKTEEKPHKQRFIPNKIPESIAESKTLQDNPRETCPLTRTSHHKLSNKNSVPEESNVRPPQYKFKESKMISISESVTLIDMQRQRNEKLLAENAAQRLAAQMVPKMATYSRGNDMSYRVPKLPEQGDSDDDDDDDDAKEIDYGEEEN